MRYLEIFGVPDRIRTCDPQIRNLVLYPTELRALILLENLLKKISSLAKRDTKKPSERPDFFATPQEEPNPCYKEISASSSAQLQITRVFHTKSQANSLRNLPGHFFANYILQPWQARKPFVAISSRQI